MKLLFSLLGFLLITSIQAQTVNGLKLSDIPADYIEVMCDENPTLGLYKFNSVRVDYGQFSADWKGTIRDENAYRILNEDGSTYELHGAMSVVNLFHENGFDLIERNLVLGQSGLYHYLTFKRQNQVD